VHFYACFTESIRWTHRILGVPKSVSEIYGCQCCSDTKQFLGARSRLCPGFSSLHPPHSHRRCPSPAVGTVPMGTQQHPRPRGPIRQPFLGPPPSLCAPASSQGQVDFCNLSGTATESSLHLYIGIFPGKATLHRYWANCHSLFFTPKLGHSEINVSKT